jgi:citrate synthase
MFCCSQAVNRHSALPTEVETVIAAMPHDAHPMGVLMTGICALSTMHPEQNPALVGGNIYKSREVQDKQIVRLLGKVRGWLGECLRYVEHEANRRGGCGGEEVYITTQGTTRADAGR